MSRHGKRSAAGQVGDDRVSDFYSYPSTIHESMGFPKTEEELIEDRLRYERDQERKQAALDALEEFRGKDGLLGYIRTHWIDWDAAMQQEVKITDNQALYLGVYLLGLTESGSLKVDPLTNWPVHWSFCGVATLLHAQNPERYRNRQGNPIGQQTVKDAVVPAFARKLHAYLERIKPGVWSYKLVCEVVKAKLGRSCV